MIPGLRALPAIVLLTLRAALREKVVLSMLVLLALLLALLPSGLRGDGTLEGALRMNIRYSLGFSSFLLALMTLWMSCGAIAADLSTKRLQMLLSKPLSRCALWFGKWLAISLLVSLLLLLCGGVTLLRVRALARAADPDTTVLLHTRLLTARLPVDPRPDDLSARARAFFDEQRSLGALPPDLGFDEALPQILSHVLALRHSARPNESNSWDFDLDRPLAPGEPLQLAFEFDGASMGSSELPSRWRVGTPDQPDLWSAPFAQPPRGEHILFPNEEGALDGATRLRVTYDNLDPNGSMVFFKTRGGVRLFRPGGAFTPNLLRAVGLIAGLLSLLAAVGVSAGAIFSLPVACYVTAVSLLLRLLSGNLGRAIGEGSLFHRDGGGTALSRALDAATLATYRGVLLVLEPLEVSAPFDRVSRGVSIPPREFASVLCLRFTPVLFVLAGAGILLFQRREIGGAE